MFGVCRGRRQSVGGKSEELIIFYSISLIQHVDRSLSLFGQHFQTSQPDVTTSIDGMEK
jgi:hypothetical protein